MRDIGNKICPKGFRSRELSGHLIDGLDDLVEAGFPGKFFHRCNTDGEISLHDFFRSFQNLLHRPLHHPFPAQVVKGAGKERDQQHISEGQLGSRTDVFHGKHQSHGICQNRYKQHHTARHHKSHDQEKHQIIINCPQELLVLGLFHLITAL